MKYKNLFFYLLAISYFMLIEAIPTCAANYYIFKYNGDVHHIVDNENRTPILRTQLTIRDRFLLGKGAVLAIADKDNNRVYVTKEAGIQNVAQIVRDARIQSASISKLVCKQAYASMKNDSKASIVLGAVNRGAGIQDDSTLLVYSSLYQSIHGHNYLDEELISLEKIEQDGEWHFKIINKMDFPLCVNILRLSEDKHQKPLLCLEYPQSDDLPSIIIAPNTELELSQFSFTVTEIQYNYLLFASKCPFDSQALRLLLNSNEKPNIDTANVKLYIKTIKL